MEVFSDRRRHVLGPEIGPGGEGVVFALENMPELAVKVKVSSRGPFVVEAALDRVARDQYARRIAAMHTLMSASHWERDGSTTVAWPLEPVRFKRGGQVVGFLMMRLSADWHKPLETLLSPVRTKVLPHATWRLCIDVALNLAELLVELHRLGIVVGDLCPSNILLTGTGAVSLIDCDSFQFTGHDSEIFTCHVASPGYFAPELIGQDLTTYVRGKATDRFALAIIICSILRLGTHPYLGHSACVSEEEAVDILMSNIATGRSHLLPEREKSLQLPHEAVPANVLPRMVLTLARRCFGPGHRQPRRRPYPQHWVTALRQARNLLVECPQNPHHTFGGNLTRCPWCNYLRCCGVDLFP